MPPFPRDDAWVTYGFCTCYTKGEQARLLSLYRKLLQQCSFNEFWDARRNSTVIALFDKYGLGSERKSFRHFQSVMDNNKALPSVWYLKSFVYDQITMELPSSMRAVMIDYGFMHCRNATDRIRLRQSYREIFDQKVDELLLHEACLAGQLFEFCSPFFLPTTWTLEDREYFQALMKNPYPLTPHVPWAGLVVENVACCKESNENLIRQMLADEGGDDDVVLFVIPDEQEDEIQQTMANLNSYRLRESVSRRYDGDGQDMVVNLSPEEVQRATFQINVDPETRERQRILLLGPTPHYQGQREDMSDHYDDDDDDDETWRA